MAFKGLSSHRGVKMDGYLYLHAQRHEYIYKYVYDYEYICFKDSVCHSKDTEIFFLFHFYLSVP